MSTYNFNTLITAIDSKAQTLAASTTDPKDLVYLGKAIEAINSETDAIAALGLLQANNLSDLQSPNTALGNLGFQISGATQGQTLIYNATLAKFVNGSASANLFASSDPATSTGDADSLGSLYVNTTTGEIWVCVSATAVKRRWLGTNGGTVGFPRGEVIVFEAQMDSSQKSGPMTSNWTVPDGVTSFCAVLVGGGGAGAGNWANSAGGGGALAWANDIPVQAGDTIAISAGVGGWNTSQGQESSISKNGTLLFKAEGGKHSVTSFSNIAKPVAGSVTPGNNNNGRGGMCSSNGYGGGGGAGGYTGNGGNGYYGWNSTGNSNNSLNNDINGTGGAGSGGGGYQSSTYSFGGGGGVGLFGEGASGSYTGVRSGFNSNSFYNNSSGVTQHHGGVGGSGGEDGTSNNGGSNNYTNFGTSDNTSEFMPRTAAEIANSVDGTSGKSTSTRYSGSGGLFGGGGAGGGTSLGSSSYYCQGGNGGVRILWGAGRSFPSTNVGYLSTLTG